MTKALDGRRGRLGMVRGLKHGAGSTATSGSGGIPSLFSVAGTGFRMARAGGKNCRRVAVIAGNRILPRAGRRATTDCRALPEGLARPLLTEVRHPANPTMIDRLDRDLNVQRAALNARAYRQELLASNIANADTPHYKARDLDFKAALSAAEGNREAGGTVALARTQAGHLPGADAGPWSGALRYRTEYQGAVDGNTVNMDVERAAFAENAMQMEALITFVRGRLRDLGTAIQGQ